MKKTCYFFSLILLISLTVNQSAQAQRRWSPQAKDATIGAGIGGAAGAIINKRNRVVGGVIGGVIGGATGYAIGKHTDNKRKEAARIAAAREAERQAAAEREAVAARQEAAREVKAREAKEARVAATAEANRVKLQAPETQTAVLSAALVAPVMTYSTVVNTASQLHSYYLPNLAYGDQSAPYGMSKYRRKSW